MFVIDNWKTDSNLYLTVANGIRKNIQHSCQQNNGGCSHICLLSEKGKVQYFFLSQFIINNGV